MHLVEQSKTVMECLRDDERAFVMAYVESGYSLAKTIESLKITRSQGNKFLARTDIRRAVMEVQNDIDSIDFLNEKWVKAQIMRLFPMVMGEEDVPAVDAQGNQVGVKQFFPAIAMKILEYVVPKKSPGVAVNVNVGSEDFSTYSQEQLDQFIRTNIGALPLEYANEKIANAPETSPEPPKEPVPALQVAPELPVVPDLSGPHPTRTRGTTVANR